MHIHSNYIVLTWCRRFKRVEISSKTLTMKVFGSTNLSYVNIVKIGLNLLF